MTFTLLEKPAYGSPCNGCGLCCIAVQCPVSTALFGEQDICPALVQERGSKRFACGLMVDTAGFVPNLPEWGGKALTETFALMIGSGIGCDGTVEGEEGDPEIRQHMRRISYINTLNASEEARTLLAYFRGDDLAQGIEAAAAGETEGLDPKGESPVPQGCAQTPPPPTKGIKA